MQHPVPELCVWVQCSEPACAKWRKMPPGYRADDPRFSGDWYCDMNPDREMAAYGCDAPQEVDEAEAAAGQGMGDMGYLQAEEAEKQRAKEMEILQARQRAAEFQRVAEMQRAAEMQRMAEMQRAAQFAHPQHGAPPPFFQPPPR